MSLSFSSVKANLPDDQLPDLPDMFPVRQHFPSDKIEGLENILEKGFADLQETDLRGQRIAVTAGSRGIKGIADILRQTVAVLKARGADPFLIPAMGSHGGATGEGQTAVLERLGIDEATVGAPIHSSMAVVHLGRTEHGLDVYCDNSAYTADGIVVCNRIKVHPVFKSDYESGIVKMMVIGLGKHKGAVAAHQQGFDRFGEVMPAAARLCLTQAPILCGVGIVENAYGELASVEVLRPEDILAREAELLQQAKRIMGRLLMDEIDILIVDKIGKDISGGGLDANITGRSAWGLPGFTAPPIQRIIVRDLTESTHGNAIGIGLADFTTRHCAEKIDLSTTYTNAITAHSLLSPKIPVITECDRDALVAALRTLRGGVPAAPRIVRILNTKDLETVWMSDTYTDFLGQSSDIEIVGRAEPLRFNDSGDLI